MSNNEFGFNIPGNEGDADRASTQEEGSYKRLLGDKPITWFWLMQHYSKANAEAYKRQKEQRKQAKRREQAQGSSNRELASSSGSSERKTCSWESSERQKPISEQELKQAQEHVARNVADDENFGETIMLNRDGTGTEIIPLNKEQSFGVVLECVGYGKSIPIRHFPCRIGRDATKVQICIADNMAVGREHAELSVLGGELCITDLNSKNGVFVNGERLEPNSVLRLTDGAEIILADECFVIHIVEGR